VTNADNHLAQLLRCDWDANAPLPALADDEWTGAVHKALHHGVAALLCRMVVNADETRVPASIVDAARTYLEVARRHGEVRVRETFEVLDTLRGDGIDALAIKGVALAALAHGDATLRPSGDIDVLVRRSDMDRAVASLSRLGYRQTEILTRRATKACYVTYGQDILFAPGRLPAEPHWTFVPRPFAVAIDLEGIWKRRTSVDVSGRALDTPSIEDALLIACLHGAKERWWRLLWVADVAALVARYPRVGWDSIIERAARVGIARILHLGLGLSQAVFGTRLPEAIARDIARDAVCRRLVAQSTQRLSNDTTRSNTLLCVSRFHLAARERLRDRVRYVARTLLTPQFRHYRIVTLPEALTFGYVPIKLVHDYLLLPVWKLGKGRLWRRDRAPMQVGPP
jgi:hypothetical protein